MWQYQRTTMVAGARGKPANATVRKCSDPNKEIRDKLAQMKEEGCQFTPMSREGSHYRSTFMCPVKGGSLTMSEVITVKGDSSYQEAHESRYGKQVTHTTIVATPSANARRLVRRPRVRADRCSTATAWLLAAHDARRSPRFRE